MPLVTESTVEEAALELFGSLGCTVLHVLGSRGPMIQSWEQTGEQLWGLVGRNTHQKLNGGFEPKSVGQTWEQLGNK